jgi:hypothetical protein
MSDKKGCLAWCPDVSNRNNISTFGQLTGLTSTHFGAFPKLGSRFEPTPYVVVFFCVQLFDVRGGSILICLKVQIR